MIFIIRMKREYNCFPYSIFRNNDNENYISGYEDLIILVSITI